MRKRSSKRLAGCIAIELALSAARAIPAARPVGITSANGAGAIACGEGAEVSGTIRAAFQMVEPAHGLLNRGEAARAFPVQAIALGRQVTILALSGEAALPEGVNPRGLIFSPFSNEASPPPLHDARVRAAIQRVLARVR